MKKALTSDSLKKGIMQASPSAQTDCLEGFHSVLNFFAPKIIAYSYLGMYCRWANICACVVPCYVSNVAAAHKVSSHWILKTIDFNRHHCFSIIWGFGDPRWTFNILHYPHPLQRIRLSPTFTRCNDGSVIKDLYKTLRNTA